MIRCFIGKPGGGKSYHALNDIIDELVFGHRSVATNLAILPGELNAYLEERFPGYDTDLLKRLRLLTNVEAKRFWLHPPGKDIPDTTPEQQKADIFPDIASAPDVLFVIDEAHSFYDSRAYMTEGPALTFVNSQHRKPNWEIVFVTQFPDLMSKRVRGFVGEWHRCRNFGVEKWFTFFRMPSRMTVTVVQNEPTPRDTQPVNEFRVVRLDLRRAKCYDTSAGVGIKGRKKPEDRAKKGISMLWFVGAVAAVLMGLSFAPEWLVKKFTGKESTAGKMYDRKAGPNGERIVGVRGGREILEGQDMKEDARVFGPRNPRTQMLIEPEGPSRWPQKVRGYAISGAKVVVMMEDGSVLTERDKQLRSVDGRGAVINGVRHPMVVPESQRRAVEVPKRTDLGRPDEKPSLRASNAGGTQ